MRGNAFSGYHPVVNFLYFTFVLVFSMVFMHPFCLLISLICAFVYSFTLKGRKAAKFNFLFLLPMLLITAIVNPAFNHEGATILTYLRSGNPLTLESIAYGLAAAAMLASVICWFSCFNEIMTSDKFVYLFGRILPSFSLILSMVLRFVPRFKAQIKIISNGQKGVGHDVSNGSIAQRVKQGIKILSIMVTWTLENAIETADSMKSRGYGLSGRTAFSIYTFDRRDRKAFAAISLIGIYIISGGMFGGLAFRYFPTMKGELSNPFTVSLYFAYLGLCLIPVIIDREEKQRWIHSQSKI
ncbi:energy-coupling factor transporter transmembrane protein EcfT [Clostridium aminobutyricum]|uniref:Energy-coupling factor transporter transmembrane protein EcfT n=2 Tax=Clostridium aminobutyricum TaxID=33953 RepID=A0A939DAG5_CLOAM|nr:energy-coupling factor transporter transmembrane component T [Clostridium aminobutyricum]MBN7774212.1 energy-coupling factor transporter transmembrane protein EcfT [Clostridium aminobutyricum]